MPKGQKGRTMVSHVCQVCSKEFEVRLGTVSAKACSRECRNILRKTALQQIAESRKQDVQCTCKTCGVIFKSIVSANSGYCSKDCWYKRNDTVRKCEGCGKEFRTPPSHMHVKTCSVECGYKVREIPHYDKRECVCNQCGKTFLESPSRFEKRSYCSNECRVNSPEYLASISRRTSKENNPNWQGGISIWTVSETGKRYSRQSRDKENAKYARRRALKLQATVAWGDKEKIDWFYKEAQTLSETTGMVYHVDHIVPLNSSKVCGLHNEFNLQLLPGPDNLRKSNRFWPDM